MSAIQTNRPIKIVAKTALFNEKGKVLVLTRSATDIRRPGGLDFPGGIIEPGEDILTGAAREIQEEIGVVASPSQLTILYAKTSPPNDEGEVVVRLFCTAQVKDPNIILSDEHSDYKWASVQEVLDSFGPVSWAQGLEFALKHGLLQLA